MNKIKINYLIIILYLLTFCGCSQEQDTIIEQYGFELTDYEIALAKISISNTNNILKASSDKRIALVGSGKVNSGDIKLYWLGPQKLSQTKNDMIFVLKECNCIVVQPKVFIKWLNYYRTIDNKLDLDLISPEEILSFFLLHEIGHIKNNDPGRAVENSKNNYNIDSTDDKEKEEKADEYAANAIKKAISVKDDYDISFSALNISMELAKFSFNLTGKRVIDSFSGSILDSPSLFQDDTKTHPNFELRILQVNDLIAGSADSKNLLESFKNRRNSGGIFPDGIIYKKEGS